MTLINVNQNLQTVFTPTGLAKTGENGLLVTSLRIIHTTPIDRLKNHVVLVDPDNIDYKVKHANKKAMEFYVNERVCDCKKGLIKKLLAQYYDCYARAVCEFDNNKLPLSVVDKYSSSIVGYKNKTLLNYAHDTFLNYIYKLESKNRYLVLSSKIDPNFRSYKLLTTRYHVSYCEKIKKRMQWLAYTYRNKPCVLLTLTFDPKKFGNDKFVMWESISKELNRFMKALRIHIQREGRTFPKYIWAVESQKNGNPHLHIVFLGATRLIDWRKIKSYWGNGAIYLNTNKDGQKVRYPINYVTGYITKTFGNTNFDNVQTQSLVWLFNHRSFNRSWNLIVPLNPKGCGDLRLDYLAVVDVLSNRLEEMDLIKDTVDNLFSSTGAPPKTKGKFVIYADENEVVSTDSVFWANFFKGG